MPTLLRALITEPAIGLKPGDGTLYGAQGPPQGLRHLGQGQLRLLAEQGQYLLRRPGHFFYRRFYRRFAVSPKEGKFRALTLPD